MAVDGGARVDRMRRGFERLFAALDDLVGPAEPPARLHGDLWGGNLLCDDTGAPCLIDPAVYGGHREVDLAMMRLFGGFGARVFAAYEEAWPLAGGSAERVAMYQLYPLMVHVNLFGGGYVGSVESTLSTCARVPAAMMEYRTLGRTDWQVSAVSFGAWAIGGSFGSVNEDESMAALHRALDRGVNFFDTADVYGDGLSERLLARLRKERKDPFYVTTKAGRRLPKQTVEGYSKKNLTGWIDRSLKNLSTEAIDLLQIHCPPTDAFYHPELFDL